MKKHILISIPCVFFFAFTSLAQPVLWSIATDLNLQHNFKKEQRFWAAGHTVQFQFHYTKHDGAYAGVSYHSVGNFTNHVTATAKSPFTIPSAINYTNEAKMRFKQISVGWKHYLKGWAGDEDNWNLYGCAGFGLLLGRVQNVHSTHIDTFLYHVPVLNGISNFKRLTLDLCLGWETNLGGAIFFYNEVKCWIPTTDYPSPYIFVNRDAPLVASIHFGIRILFD